MKTIILSGGIGYRLKEETEFKPKPMVLVGGKPLLWHIMKIYAHFGFSDFIVALGYKGEYVKDYFLNQKYFLHDFLIETKTGRITIFRKRKTIKKDDNFSITFADTGVETLPGERIMRAQMYIPKTDKYFMVTYGDGVGNINVRDLVSFHKKQGTIGTITGVYPSSKYGIVKEDSHHKVTEFMEKPTLPDWVNGGFMIFKRSAFNYFRSGEYEHNALKRMVSKKQLSLYVHKGFWHSMDTYADLEYLNASWKNNPPWKLWND